MVVFQRSINMQSSMSCAASHTSKAPERTRMRKRLINMSHILKAMIRP